MMRLFFTNVQCHSQTVGHSRQRYNEIAFPKLCNVTHLLLVIRKATVFNDKMCNGTHSLLVTRGSVMRLPFGTKHEISLTSCSL